MAVPEGTSTKGAHLRQVQKHKGIDLVSNEECPKELEHVWSWFLELCSGRANTGFGPAPISFSEVKAWSEMTGVTPTPWEVTLLKRLDSFYLSIMVKRD
jgi:hypothetical protein